MKILLVIIILLFFVVPVYAKPLPYQIQNNSLEIYHTMNDVYSDYNYSITRNVYRAYFSDNMSKDRAFLFEYDRTNVSFVPKSILAQDYDKTGIKTAVQQRLLL